MQGQEADDIEMPRLPPPPLPMDIDTQLLIQMFSDIVGASQDIQSLQ